MGKLKDIFSDTEQLDGKSVSFLIRAIEDNNVAGFDYLEFKQSIVSLKEMGIEEDIAIKSAFATASTMGLDKKKLLDSASYYQKVLKSEKDKFDEAHQKQVKTNIDDKKAKIDQLKGKIEEINNKIRELEQKVSTYQQVIEKARADIDLAQEKIEDRKQKFENAFQNMHGEIEKDKSVFEDKI